MCVGCVQQVHADGTDAELLFPQRNFCAWLGRIQQKDGFGKRGYAAYPARRTISAIHSGAKGEVQPLGVG